MISLKTSIKVKYTLLRLQLSLIGGASLKKRSETTSFLFLCFSPLKRESFLRLQVFKNVKFLLTNQP